MPHIPARLTDFLDQNAVPYHIVRHAPDVHARDAARDSHIPDRQFAKTLFVRIDGRDAMAVLPASHSLSTHRLRSALRVPSVELMEEQETAALCPDCDLGAAPPFGNLYGIPVYVSPALREHEHIAFCAGTHEHVIQMRYEDYERLVQPRVVHMARHEPEQRKPSAQA
jgi:Ala-tRNA(Pro) deacylase